MELLQLKYFYETARTESIAKTAEKFMVPASSVSASIKRLENELGISLFERRSNRIKLNEHGYILAESLGEMFSRLSDTVAAITEQGGGLPEISILILARRKWITELIIEYKRTHPETQFRIFNDVHTTDIDSFDVIIDEPSERYNGFRRSLLCIEEICIKAAKDNKLVGKRLSFSDLRREPFVMPIKEVGIRKLLEETGRKNGFEPKITIECNDSYCLAKYVKADMGLTLGSKRALAGELESDMVALDVTDFGEVQPIYVHHRTAPVEKPYIDDFCNFLIQKGNNLKK